MDNPLALLNDLRDLQLPEAVSWWPPAIGWWLLVAAAAAVFAICHFRNRPQKMPAAAADELAFAQLERAEKNFAESGDWRQLGADLSALLRQVAMTVSTRQEAASLTGTAWLQWLDQKAGKPLFEEGAGRLLADMHYRPSGPAGADAEKLIGVCYEWLRAVFARNPDNA